MQFLKMKCFWTVSRDYLKHIHNVQCNSFEGLLCYPFFGLKQDNTGVKIWKKFVQPLEGILFVFKCFSKSASLVHCFNYAITSVKDHYHILLYRHVSKRYSLPTILRLFNTNASKKELLIDKAPSESFFNFLTYRFICPTYYVFLQKQCLLAAPVVFIPVFG